MRHRLAAGLFRFYEKYNINMELNKQTKIKALFSIATVSNFPISMIQHQDRQIK
jgi:hypothetical protein